MKASKLHTFLACCILLTTSWIFFAMNSLTFLLRMLAVFSSLFIILTSIYFHYQPIQALHMTKALQVIFLNPLFDTTPLFLSFLSHTYTHHHYLSHMLAPQAPTHIAYFNSLNPRTAFHVHVLQL